jgi:hypothetical protein
VGKKAGAAGQVSATTLRLQNEIQTALDIVLILSLQMRLAGAHQGQ